MISYTVYISLSTEILVKYKIIGSLAVLYNYFVRQFWLAEIFQFCLAVKQNVAIAATSTGLDV